MNKDLLKLFFVVILLFAVLEQKCSDSDINRYLKFIPEGQIKESCKKFPKDLGALFLFELIRKSKNRVDDLADFLVAQKKFSELKKLDFLPGDDSHITRGED